MKAMNKRSNNMCYKRCRGQSLVEYSTLLGLVVAILMTMAPLMRRGIQGMVKGVADQIGNHYNLRIAEGDEKKGRFLYYNMTMDGYSDKRVKERLKEKEYQIYDSRKSKKDTMSLMGFREYPDQ